MASDPTPDRHQQTPYPLRLPPETRQKLTAEALKSRRSLNNEIVVRLEQSLEQPTQGAQG